MPSHFHFFLVPLPLCPVSTWPCSVFLCCAPCVVFCCFVFCHVQHDEGARNNAGVVIDGRKGEAPFRSHRLVKWSEVNTWHGMDYFQVFGIIKDEHLPSSQCPLCTVSNGLVNAIIRSSSLPLCICADSVIRSETHTDTPIQIHLERPEGIRSRTSRGRTVKCHRVT